VVGGGEVVVVAVAPSRGNGATGTRVLFGVAVGQVCERVYAQHGGCPPDYACIFADSSGTHKQSGGGSGD